MDAESDPQFEPQEFYPVFGRLPKGGDAVICGGQAVNLLAAVFLSDDELNGILGDKGSATSGDMDIVVSKELKELIEKNQNNKAHGFRVKRFADCRQPIEFAIIPDDMPDTRIDVLRSVKGVDIKKDRVFENAIDIEAPFKVMNPVTLLIAKAENCATLEQMGPNGKRNDITHLKMLVPIVRNYFNELVTHSDPTPQAQRGIINQLKRLQAASTSLNFIKGFRIADVKLSKVVPAKVIQEGRLPMLKEFFERTWIPKTNARQSEKPLGPSDE